MKQKRSKTNSESTKEVKPSSDEAQGLEKKYGRPGDEQFGNGPASYNSLLHECLLTMRREIYDPVLAHAWQHLFRYLIPAVATKVDPLARQTCHARYKGHSAITATICFVEAWAAHNGHSFQDAVEDLDTEQFECIWKARQNADFLGVEYRAYIEAMNLLYGPDGPRAGLEVSALSGPLSLALAYRQLRSPYAGMPLPVEIEVEILGEDVPYVPYVPYK